MTHPVFLCPVLQHQLVSTPRLQQSRLFPLSHCPARLAGRPALLSFSSTPPLSVSFKPPLPLPFLDTPASSPSLCNAASSLQQAWGLLDRSPLSSPPLCLTQGILYGLIYLPSLPFLSCLEAELLTSCRFHSWAGSLRQTAVEDRYKNPKATQMHLI